MALGIGAGERVRRSGHRLLVLAKFLVQEDEVLDPADYDMIGVLGRVSSTIRPSRHRRNDFLARWDRGARAPARSEDGLEIPKGSK